MAVWVSYITGTGTKEIDECSYHPDDENEATNIGRRFVTLTYCEDIIECLKQDVKLKRYEKSFDELLVPLTEIDRIPLSHEEELELLKTVQEKAMVKVWQKL